MKKIIALLCTFFFNISFAFVCETTVLVNPETNKKVVLLSDIHQLERFMKDPAALDLYSDLASQQSEQLAQFTNDLLALQDASHIAVATEINANSFGSLYEQEVGAIKRSKSAIARLCGYIFSIFIHDGEHQRHEAILAMPRVLLRAVLKNGADLQASMKPFFGFPTASFSLPNNLQWIAADRYRTTQDAHLAFTFYTKLSHVLDGIKKQNLVDEMKELTIEFVERYVHDLHAYFEKLGIENPYVEPIKKEIAEALKTGNVHATDHFAQLHTYLVDTGKQKERDCLNNNILCLVSLKLDAEMLEYVKIFNQEKSLTTMLAIAGAAHNTFLKKILISQGYAITQHSGIWEEEDGFIEAYKSNDMLSFVQKLQKNVPNINVNSIMN